MNHHYASNARPFVSRGAEKMVYDLRSGPQVVKHHKDLYVAALMHENSGVAHPHIMKWNAKDRARSKPVKLAEMPVFNHHFTPVLWFDRDERIHVLTGCHGRLGHKGGPGLHLVSGKARHIGEWHIAPDVGSSISYPRLIKLPSGRLILYYRFLGHMGAWGYKTSDDGGFNWSEFNRLFDFDQNPVIDDHLWAGSYHSVLPDPDGTTMHIGLVHMDERRSADKTIPPTIRNMHRHNLYYGRLDAETGKISRIDGTMVDKYPITMSDAESLLVWDTGKRFSNVPAISLDPDSQPVFLLPVTEGENHHDAAFHCIALENGRWIRHKVVKTDSTWNGCWLQRTPEAFLADLIVPGDDNASERMYGGGKLQRWQSNDKGKTWEKISQLPTDNTVLVNNPRRVELSDGKVLEDSLVFLGWQGPKSLQQYARDPGNNTTLGNAFIYCDDHWTS